MFETDDGIVINGFQLRDVVGRSIICEDGVCRKVEQISYSQRFADKVLVNEINEDETPGGAWVHVLSLARQMHDQTPATMDQKKAFSRTMGAIRFEPERDALMPGFIKLPSGILLSR